MDYTQTLVELDSIVTHSNIQFVSIDGECSDSFHGNEVPKEKQQGQKTDTEQDSTNSTIVAVLNESGLHKESLRAANEAACEYFLGKTSRNHQEMQITEKNQYLINSKRYKQKYLPVKEIIEVGDLIVIQEAFGKLSFVYVSNDDIYSNRNGHFHHNDFIGKRFGCKIRSRNNHGYGFIYLLRPTTELWTKSLVHRTQIVHELDQSQIIYQLYIKPGSIVIESGTGSGAVSYSIARTIAPTGHLHTFEFNEHRYQTAKEEFEKNKLLSNFATVYHRDVCTNGFADNDNIKINSIDAMFLDLPEPWHAITYASKLLKLNSRIASYSPCIEQTQRVVQELELYNFHTIQTYEYRLQEHYVDEVEYGLPPTSKRSKPTQHDIQSYHQPQQDGDSNISMEVCDKSLMDVDNERKVVVDSSKLADSDLKAEFNLEKTQEISNVAKTPALNANHSKNDKQRSDEMLSEKKSLLVARPFTMMRGHTAFLTFATFGGIFQERIS